MEDHGTGLEKFGALAAMVRRRASTCFAFMLPKSQVGAVDLFAGTEGTLHGVSNKGVSSLLFLGVARLTPTLSSPVLFSRTHTPIAARPAAGSCKPGQIALAMIFTTMTRPFAGFPTLVEGSSPGHGSASARPGCRVQENFGAT
jgi:hypothetical protein